MLCYSVPDQKQTKNKQKTQIYFLLSFSSLNYLMKSDDGFITFAYSCKVI